MAGFPIQLEGEVKGTPAVCDCDGDGKTEIVEAGWDKNVYVWDYDYTFSPGGAAPPWPQFYHDSQRTGSAGTPILLGVEDRSGTPPGALELARPAPNPARAASRLTYGVPADHAGQAFELAVFDLSGRRLRTLARGVARAGRFSAAWDLSDERGAQVADGVYFLRLSLGGHALSRKLAVLR